MDWRRYGISFALIYFKLMKRILIVTGIFQPDIGGPASYAEVIGQKLAENFKVSLVTYSSVWKFAEDHGRRFKVTRIWRKWPWLLRHILFLATVFFKTRSSKIVFSLSTLNGGLAGLCSARFFRRKFFIRIVGDYAWQWAVLKGKTSLLIDDFQKASKKGRVKWLWRLQSFVCREADGVVVPSEYISRLVQGWGVAKEKITVIYNGADFKPSDLSKEEARKKIGIAGNILLTYGRLVPWKGYRMLVKLMPKLLAINQFFRLVIVGEGPEEKVLQMMVKNLGLEKKVYLLGKQNKEQLAIFLAAAEMFILNTGYEGFSHEILETMRSGVPIITTSAGGNREIIRQGENGFMVKYNDEFNLAEAVKTVWQTPELQKRFKEEGQKTTANFSVEKMINKTIKVFASV